MSLVPSEIEYQNDSDALRETARISGVVVVVLLGVLASGFASVGFLAFDEMTGGAPRVAEAPREGETPTAGAESADAVRTTEPQVVNNEQVANDEDESDPVPDETNAPANADEPILDDAAEFVVAQAPQIDEPSFPSSAPTIKPTSGRAPTVMYDAAVFDEADAAPETFSGAEVDEAATPDSNLPAPEKTPGAQPQETAPPVAVESPPPPAPVAEAAPTETAPDDTPAIINPLSGSHVVQLASYRSEAEATADWRRIETRLGAYLAAKTYQIERADLGERGVFHRLRIGPFTSSDAAQSYCAGLKERGQDCLALRR